MSKLNQIELLPGKDQLTLILYLETDNKKESKIRFKYDSGVDGFYKLLAEEIKAALPENLK